MKNFKSHFKFSKQERSGIFFLLLLLIGIQVGYFIYQKIKTETATSFVVNSDLQQKIDSIKAAALKKDVFKIYPFNPNFITDYKGYTLGMSVDEIQRLHQFRAQDKYVNSAAEFQSVTQVSDSLLGLISINFKFPEWTQKKKNHSKSKERFKTSLSGKNTDLEIKIKDLNSATAEELIAIYGIGDKLSSRIIKFRDRLGGFLTDQQLYDVYGLKPDVADNVLKRFRVIKAPEIEKVDLNRASVEELSKLVYLQRRLAQDIVDYRNRNGNINSFDELSKIENFPMEKIDRIALYLSLKK